MSFQDYKFIKINNKEIWKHELTYILERDIHETGLGCCISNTHVKIGNVHIGKFYEAQFLFGNSYWISIFAESLKRELEHNNGGNLNNALLVGYETYIEPVLLKLKELLVNYNVDICLYEGEKYIAHNHKSKVRLRAGGINEKLYNNIILICGISSTLNTFKEIICKINNDSDIKKNTNINYISYSIIQVLPEDFRNFKNNKFDLKNDGYLIHNEKLNIVTRYFNDSSGLETKYLIHVFCEWQLAEDCKWCYIDEYERPLITTNDTSVIPVQMIGMDFVRADEDINKPFVDFFKRIKKEKKYSFINQNYLYYDHIERDSHHFHYYIRTNSLLKNILLHQTKELEKFFDYAKGLILNKNSDDINVIVVPIHYSNGHFVNIISKYIFDNRVEIISFDPRKEYRSNFLTKFSNYSYIFEALKNNSNVNVNFHYVDDQIITGNTFYKTKSYVTSLMKMSKIKDLERRVKIFSSIITLINRNSNSTKFNYIEDDKLFLSVIDIDVPYLRNHGDSCYLCSRIDDFKKIRYNSALLNTQYNWLQHEKNYHIKYLDEMKSKKQDKEERKKIEHLSEAGMIRFYCENLLWKNIKSNWGNAQSVYNKILEIILKELKMHDSLAEQYEYLISFIEVSSKPYLYFRENIKKAVHAILVLMIHILSKYNFINPIDLVTELSSLACENYTSSFANINKIINEDNQTENTEIDKICALYMIILSRLSSINSNYLLKSENIVSSIDFFKKIRNNKNVDDIYEIILENIKLIVNGISGKYKAMFLDKQIKQLLINPSEHYDFFVRIYLENLETIREKNVIETNQKVSDNPIILKYEKILEDLNSENPIALIVKSISDKKTQESFVIVSNSKYKELNVSIDTYEKYISNNDFYVMDDYVFIKCYSSIELGDVFLVIKKLNKNMDKYTNSYVNFLDEIRNVLLKRYEIYSHLCSDDNSGAIKELYLDTNFMKMLLHPKRITHGNSQDISDHLDLLEHRYQLYDKLYKNKTNNHEDFKIYDVRKLLRIFSNLLISFMHLSRIAEERSLQNKFNKYLSPCNITNIITLRDDSESYSQKNNDSDTFKFDNDTLKIDNIDINDFFMERLKYYIYCMENNNDNLNIKFNVDILNKITINKLLCLNDSHQNNIWITFALIHMIIENAITHGDNTQIIDVEFELKDNEVNLIVKNKMKKASYSSDRGITQDALKYILKEKFYYNESQGDYESGIKGIINGGELCKQI